jgi:uncharacterized protein YndB with AHSA1/START domain
MMENKAKSLPDIRKTLILNASIQKVWETVATQEGIQSWFMPNDFEAKLGHRFTLETPYGPQPCQVLELDPPHLLTFSWGEFGWRVTFQLKELEGKTEFTLIHAGWGEADQIIPESGETMETVRKRMDGGWEGIVLQKLREVAEA